MTFNENLNLDLNIPVTFEGGYDTNFSSPPTGYTTVSGSLRVSNGTAVLDRLVIK
jgi:hypothetical protein